MSTTLYLGNSDGPFVTGSHSAVLPAGTLVDFGYSPKRLSANKGGAADIIGNTLAQIARQDNYLGAYITKDALLGQTIPAQTWTFAAPFSESSASANAFLALSIYVYRPSTGAIVGYIYDAATALGNEWQLNSIGFAGRLVAVSGASVVVLSGDYLVCEVWSDLIQANATSRALAMRIGQSGADASEDSASGTAAFLSSPATLSFHEPVVVIGVAGYTVNGATVVSNYDGILDLIGFGSPENVVSAPVGSTYRRKDGGAGTGWYVKESGGSGNTGWVGK